MGIQTDISTRRVNEFYICPRKTNRLIQFPIIKTYNVTIKFKFEWAFFHQEVELIYRRSRQHDNL